MPISVESGTCLGKGFDSSNANGFLAKLANFLRRPVSAGAWQAVTVNDSSTMSGVTLPDGPVEVVFNIDNGAVLPTGIVAGASYFAVKSVSVFSLFSTYGAANLGTSPISWASNGSGSFYLQIKGGGAGWTQLADAGGAQFFRDAATVSGPNDITSGLTGKPPKFISIDTSSIAGKVAIQFGLGYIGPPATISLIGIFSGYLIDASDSSYLYDFRAGNGSLVISSRVGSSWSHAGIDDFIPDANLMETSTPQALTSGATAGAGATIPLAGHGTGNFVAGNWYYIMNTDGTGFTCEYVRCATVEADSITVDNLVNNFASGSVIGPYPHQWYTFGTLNPASPGVGFNAPDAANLAQIPYFSATDSTHVRDSGSEAINSGIGAAISPDYLKCMNPDDKGQVAVMAAGITEKYRPNDGAVTDMNRGYGLTSNILFCAAGSMIAAQDGLTVGAKAYVFFSTADKLFSGGSSDIAVLFPQS